MGTPKKKQSQRKTIRKPGTARAKNAGNAADNAHENQWQRCLPLSAATLSAVEKQMGVSLPTDLKALVLSCNGGKPAKTYFVNDRIEVEIGSLLPIRPPASHKGSSFEHARERLVKAGLPSTLLPFAYDNGNAGIFCLDVKSGAVVYWVHDDPDDPLKYVTASLTDFLSKLSVPPY